MAQNHISVGYLGQMATHPGIKVGFSHALKQWTREKTDKKGETKKVLTKALTIAPGIGFYHQRRYQTGFMLHTELGLTRKNDQGGFLEYGISMGYLTTRIPNSYVLDSRIQIAAKPSGYQYALPGVFFTVGKDLSVAHNTSLGWYVKPQFFYAFPNFPTGVGYFMVEVGIRHFLKKAS